MSGVGCRGNDSCQKPYGKGNSSSSQSLHSSIYSFSTFIALQNTNIWNKPGCLPLVWVIITQCSCPLTERWPELCRSWKCCLLTSLDCSNSCPPYKCLNHGLPFLCSLSYLLQAHLPPRCDCRGECWFVNPSWPLAGGTWPTTRQLY